MGGGSSDLVMNIDVLKSSYSQRYALDERASTEQDLNMPNLEYDTSSRQCGSPLTSPSGHLRSSGIALPFSDPAASLPDSNGDTTISTFYKSSTWGSNDDNGDEVPGNVRRATAESEGIEAAEQSATPLSYIQADNIGFLHQDDFYYHKDILLPQAGFLSAQVKEASYNGPLDDIAEDRLLPRPNSPNSQKTMAALPACRLHSMSEASSSRTTTSDEKGNLGNANNAPSSSTPRQDSAVSQSPIHGHSTFQEYEEDFPPTIGGPLSLGIKPSHDTADENEDTQGFEEEILDYPPTHNGDSLYSPWFIETQDLNMSSLGPATSLPDVSGFPRPASGLVTTNMFGDLHDPDEDFERNLDVCEFFEHWRADFEGRSIACPRIGLRATQLRESCRPDRVTISDLDDDCCDYQGIDWRQLGTTRREARTLRNQSYTNYTNVQRGENIMHRLRHPANSDFRYGIKNLVSSDSHFRFDQLRTRHKAHLSHFQLRNLISAPSKNCVFYAGRSKIFCIDTILDTERCVMDFTEQCPSPDMLPPRKISTMIASREVLIAGGFGGEYAMKSLYSKSDTPYIPGIITSDSNSITNHIHITPSRASGLPLAVFASNDDTIRILDCTSATFLYSHRYPWAVNCSATSPDHRLRLIVGDDVHPWIVQADTGACITQLSQHRDFGFACDWAPDGIHLATGNQDGVVQIFDARNWSRPLQMIAAEIGGVRSMHFSPVGSGRRTLVLAEPADVVSVVDAVGWKSRQRFDFWGEIAGTSITDDGESLFVANTDAVFGGLMAFERVQSHVGTHQDHKDEERSWEEGGRSDYQDDWAPESELDDDPRVVHSATHREPARLGLDDLIF